MDVGRKKSLSKKEVGGRASAVVVGTHVVTTPTNTEAAGGDITDPAVDSSTQCPCPPEPIAWVMICYAGKEDLVIG